VRVGYEAGMTSSSLYAGHRFPAELISYTVWLYFRFPLSLRMVEEMLVFRGIEVSHETIRQWGLKFGQEFANIIRRRLPRPGDKWHMDEVVLKIAGKKHYLWRAVDQHGVPPGGRCPGPCSTSWFRAGAIRRRPKGCCASC
jgi:putative transposase